MPGPFRSAPPPLGERVITRPRLLRPLLTRFTVRCTLIVAGAGCGKTTLLSQALAENALSPRGDDVWVRLEATDADAGLLAAQLLTSLGGDRGDRGVADAAAVANLVWQRAPTEVCLVLDDVHRLPAGSPGAELVAELLEVLPANGHLLIAGRDTPAVPYAHLAGQGELLRVGEDDLRFDAAELDAFAASRDLPPEQLARTAGWPAMAELVASAGVDLVGEFLWQEVLEPLDEEQRTVLAVLADLGEGDDELLSAALDRTVEFRPAVPLISTNAEGWHEPHALWHSESGLRLDPDERRTIRRRAGRHLLHRGRLPAAFELFAGAELWDEVPPVLAAACRSGMRPPASQLGDWLARCPDAVLATPAGHLGRGVLAAMVTPDLAATPLRDAIAAFRAAGDPEGELSAISHLGHVAWWQRELAVLAELSPRVSELATAGEPTAVTLDAIGRALLCNIAGDHTGVVAAVQAIDPGALHGPWVAVAGWFRGHALLMLGDSDAGLAELEQALQVADPGFRLTVDATMTTARWLLGRSDDLPAEAAALLAEAESSGIALDIAAVAASNARACAYMGHRDAARAHLAAARRVEAHLTPAGRVHIVLAEAAMAVAGDDEPSAVELLEHALERHPLDDVHATSSWRTDPAMTYVLVPGQRATWRSMHGPPRMRWVIELAECVVAAREGRRSASLDTVGVADPKLVRSALLPPFAVDLAVALHGAGRHAESTALLEVLGHRGRALVRRSTTEAARSLLATVPAPPALTVVVRALGPLTVDGRAVDRQRVRELLGYLLLHRRTTRGALTAAIWPDLDDRAAGNNLRVTLSHLAKLLEPDREEGEAAYLLRHSASELRLVTDRSIEVDLDRFEADLSAASVAEADGAPSVALEHLLAATDLYGGDLLADLPDVTWADLERERLRGRFVRAAVRAGELLNAAGEPDRAEQLAARALSCDEWCEPAYGVLATAALVRGDRPGALRAVRRCQEVLDELGVSATEATARLARRIRSASSVVA